jgi:hypothetical protein
MKKIIIKDDDGNEREVVMIPPVSREDDVVGELRERNGKVYFPIIQESK